MSRFRVAWAAMLSLLVGCATEELAAGPSSTTPGSPTARAPRVAPDDGDLLGVVPAGTETVIEVDVAQLRASNWSSRLVAIPDDERAAKTAAQGFDEIGDVDRAVFAVSEAAGGPATLIVVQGRFDAGRLARAMADESNPASGASHWRGSRIWTKGDQATALLTARTLIRGEPISVRAAIDCAWGLAPDVRGTGVGEQGRELHAAGERPALIAASMVTEAMRKRVEGQIELPVGLERAGARLDLGAALEIELVGRLTTPREAEATAHNLEATVRALRARRALAIFGLTPFLERLTVVAQGRQVRARLTLPEDRREDLASKLAFVLETIRSRAR
jgi:hypothetical protein